MRKDKSVKKQKRAEFLEYVANAMRPMGENVHLTEKEILKKRRLERSKSQLEKEHDLAK
jgi:hypothetical protein